MSKSIYSITYIVKDENINEITELFELDEDQTPYDLFNEEYIEITGYEFIRNV